MTKRIAAIGVAAVLAALPAPAQAKGCGDPVSRWQKRAPEQAGMDSARLQELLDWGLAHTSAALAVYRHGCLVGESRADGINARTHLDGWSMTKSVTAMVVGRAVTLGRLDIDAPIGALYPEAGPEHAQLTPRHLLTMTAGTHRNFIRDLSPQPDRVRDALSLPFEHAPGTHWEYQQSNVTLLADVVTRSTGQDVEAFAQQELFGRIGMRPADYTWDRDRAGHPEGWAHLRMTPAAWGRLGHLMLRGGRWRGRRLISRDYLADALRPQEINNAYGFLFWLNGGGSYVMPAAAGEDAGTGQIVPAGPRDMFLMCGIGEQRVLVIPSRDLVVVRLGDRGSRELDTRVVLWTGRAGEVDHELARGALRAVTDVPYSDPGPYAGSDLTLPPPDEGVVGDAQELDHVLAGLGLRPPASR